MSEQNRDDSTSLQANSSADDPVRQRRTSIARWTTVANRLGYTFYGIAIVLFVIAFIVDWSSGFSTAITVCLVLGSILLAPAIVLGYAIKAAEREDAEIENKRRNRE
ncbi:MAG: hypothetical protein RLZ37_1548 [Actinomycetota bacterium]